MVFFPSRAPCVITFDAKSLPLCLKQTSRELHRHRLLIYFYLEKKAHLAIPMTLTSQSPEAEPELDLKF